MTPFTRATAAVLAEIACGEENAPHIVRAVLQAIREPSEGMVEAGGLSITADDQFLLSDNDRAATAFTAMIDKVMQG